jgi:Helix-turn-helix.
MTQTELAEAVGETKQTIYKYEHGVVTNIPLAKIEALAKALNCPPVALAGWDGGGEAAEPEDAELAALLKELREREDMRMLFKLAAGASPEDVRQAVRIIEALREK